MEINKIKEDIKKVNDTIEMCIYNIDICLKPYDDSAKNLEKIKNNQDIESDIHSKVGWLQLDILRSCIQNNKDIKILLSQLEDLTFDLEDLQEKSKNNTEQINTNSLVKEINTFKCRAIDYIEYKEDLQIQLEELKNSLNNFKL